MLPSSNFQLPDEEDEEIARLQPEVLRSKWRHAQMKKQKHLSVAIDSTWRLKQVSGSGTQSTFSELGLGQSECSSVDDFTTGTGLMVFESSEDGPKWFDDRLLAGDMDQSDDVQIAELPTPCVPGWLSKKKSSTDAFMKPFSRCRKSWFSWCR